MLTYLEDEISSDYKDRYRFLYTYTYCLLVESGYEIYLEKLSLRFNNIGVLILCF